MFRTHLVFLAFVLAPLAASAGSGGVSPPPCMPGQASCVPPELPPSGHRPAAGHPRGTQPPGGPEAPAPASRPAPDTGTAPSSDEPCAVGRRGQDADCVREGMSGGKGGAPRRQDRTGAGAAAGPDDDAGVRPGQ